MVKDLCFEIIEKCLNNCKFCSSNSDCNKKQIIEFEDFKRNSKKKLYAFYRKKKIFFN